MFNKTRRFFYLTYEVSKILLKYRKISDERDPKKLREFGIYLRNELEGLGPTFVKLGQMLSLRLDLLHPIICRELRQLLDNEKKIDFRLLKPILEKEYGKSLKDVFKTFDETPLASASVAQVHRAELKNGRDVSVKIRKPGVKEEFEEDIEILFTIFRVLSVDPHLRKLGMNDILKQFSDWTEKELNFLNEGKNMERFKKNFSSFDFVAVPNVYWDLTRENILVYRRSKVN